MNEREMIEKLNKLMPKSLLQFNKPFESDSEIVEFNSGKLLYTMDEFSEEDLFLESDPYVLGYNIAAASISDIYASGGVPKYYAHSLTVNNMFTAKYLEKFYKGIADVLRQTDTAFIGGDFGRSEVWRCCASVIGVTENPIMRSGANIGDNIYITGEIGGGNMQAAAKLYNANILTIKFKLQNKESEIIRLHATSCIDTSDGVFNALCTIAQQSNIGFELNDLPYEKAGVVLAKMLKQPKEMLFLCECGEYELLFTAPYDIELPFKKIGTITENGKTLDGKDISKIDISARDYENPKEYLKAVKELCGELL